MCTCVTTVKQGTAGMCMGGGEVGCGRDPGCLTGPKVLETFYLQTIYFYWTLFSSNMLTILEVAYCVSTCAVVLTSDYYNNMV